MAQTFFFFLQDTLAHDSASPFQICFCFLKVIQKISSGQTFTDILNLRCDLGIKRSNPIFQQDTPAYDAVQSSQVWLQMD